MKYKCRFLAAILAVCAFQLCQASDSILYSFPGNTADGGHAFGGVTLSGAKLYGMTCDGSPYPTKFGAVFCVNLDGSGYQLLHSFAGGNTDGRNYQFNFFKRVLIVSGTMLYGITDAGGAGDHGTIFSVNIDGSGYNLLHSFVGADGGFPDCLVLSGSTLYGSTQVGASTGFLNGTIFSINTDGSKFKVLYAFTGGSGSTSRHATSILLSGTMLYGTAIGSSSPDFIFRLNTDGTGFNSIHSFTNGGAEGSGPVTLTLGGSKFYGATAGGGASNCGTVFSMNTDGSDYRVLHAFSGSDTDGYQPDGVLVISGSKIYGTTYLGYNYMGSVFSLNTDGSNYSILRYFVGYPSDGRNPVNVTLSDDWRVLYGITLGGGTTANGTIFSVALPAPPIPALQIARGLSGSLEVRWPLSASDWTLETSSDLILWTSFPGPYNADASGNVYSAEPSDPSRFYRLRWLPGNGN